MQKTILTTLLLLFGVVFITAQTQRKITKSSVTFRIKNAGSWVDGSLGNVSGTVKFDEKSANNSIDASVEVKTISTKNEKRDHHLNKDDFFDSEKTPLIKIASQKITHKDEHNYEGDFKITIKNTAKNMTIPFTYKNGVFSASFIINRQDFNIGGGTMILSEMAYVVVVFGTE